MSLEDRLTNFVFHYHEDGPRLNPHILDKLKPRLSEMSQEKESRLSPDLPSMLVGLPAPYKPPPSIPKTPIRTHNRETETSTQIKTQKLKRVGGQLNSNVKNTVYLMITFLIICSIKRKNDKISVFNFS